VRESASEVKRETDQAAQEVRIMTVHGAKGLEANIVILADTCSNRGAKSVPIYFIEDGAAMPALPVWAVKGTSDLPPIAAAKEERKEDEQRELGRLLYVAMTRARDRLYVAGFHNNQDVPEGCWYDVIRSALGTQLVDAEDFAGRKVQCFGSAGDFLPSGQQKVRKITPPLPGWIEAGPPAERRPPIVAPSRLLPWAEAEGSHHGAGAPRETAREQGNLVHKLLEILPKLEPADRDTAAHIIAGAFSGGLSFAQRKEAIDGVFALLSDPSMQSLFQNGHPEAALAMTLEGADGGTQAIMLGQVDRILFGENGITVLDYKSSRFLQGEDVPRAYLAQLAGYNLALQRICPESDVVAALLNTRLRTLAYGDGEVLASLLADLGDRLGDAPYANI
jgi:ATP-dependent helicase/nuclease subunit A